MTPETPAPPQPGPAATTGRAITEIGPFRGATSFAMRPGLVFVSADGTWGRRIA